MKKYIITIALLLPMFVIGQSQDKNYVKTTSYQQAVDEGQEDNLDPSQKIEAISYVDGLGRPIQSIAIGAGGQGQNIISYTEYDEVGRTPKQYLPFATASGVPNPLDFVDPLTLKADIHTFYNTPKYEDTQNPYSEMVYEASPLNRVLKQGAPGNSWAVGQDDTDHTIKFDYTSNQADEVRFFDITYAGGNTIDPSLSVSGYYPINQLYKNITKDENWTPTSGNNHTTEEFTNKSGQVLLKRTYNNGQAHDTYYIYDDYGNLSFVLSPEASDQIIDANDNLVTNYQDILDKLGYQYKYDYRNRLIEKKIPAKGWEYIVYNKLDQPVLTQDARLRENNQWLLTKYDALGRVAYTGIAVSSESRQWQQNTANNLPAYSGNVYEQRSANTQNIAGTLVNYSNQSFPVTNITEVLTVNYYDSYVDHSGITLPSSVYNQNITSATQGLPTVSKVRVLGTGDWITSVTGYDEKARPIFGATINNYLSTEDTSESLLDFTGKVLESRTTHQKSGHQEVVTKDYFTYDHQNRLITHMQQIDNEPVQLIASNSYDELGQLESKRVGGQLFESGYTDLVNVTVSNDGHLITKADPSDSYNAGLATIGKLEDNGGISFTIETIGSELRVGLNNINTDPSAGGMNYYYLFTTSSNANGYLYRVYTRAIAGGGSTLIYSGRYLSDTNNFNIEIEQGIAYFKQNGITKVSTPLEDSEIPLIGDISLKTPNSQISNLNLYATTIDKSLQKVDYQYNVRGWLTDINDVNDNSTERDLFNFHINYDTKEGMTSTGSITPLYNGNISQTMWSTANTDSQIRAYGYAYDDLNRINGGFSRKGTNYNTVDSYTLFNINYDRNGNIETLKRNGYIPTSPGYQLMDDLSYTYNGNQLLNVTEGSTSSIKKQGFYDGNTSATLNDYEYDVNGNMIKDRNKGITDNIEYNHLNLPETVRINTVDAQGDTQQGTISYIYDATGIKLAKIMNDEVQNSTITTYYAGGYIYENNNNNVESLKMFPHPEGYVEPVYGTSKSIGKFSTQTQTASFSNYQYAFNYTDHLGNVRLTYADSDGDGAIEIGTEIISEKHYYPFGLQQKGYNDVITSNSNSVANRFGYNGKEFDPSLGLNTYDFGARNYSPDLGRWMNIDPLADSYPTTSPYTYALNNPISFVDFDGRSPDPILSKVVQAAIHNTAASRALQIINGAHYKVFRKSAFDSNPVLASIPIKDKYLFKSGVWNSMLGRNELNFTADFSAFGRDFDADGYFSKKRRGSQFVITGLEVVTGSTTGSRYTSDIHGQGGYSVDLTNGSSTIIRLSLPDEQTHVAFENLLNDATEAFLQDLIDNNGQIKDLLELSELNEKVYDAYSAFGSDNPYDENSKEGKEYLKLRDQYSRKLNDYKKNYEDSFWQNIHQQTIDRFENSPK
ncbi:DUF6443 domain-containing protein [Dokdonia ponticola]|uniref:DUF6443 domain-containing protein n=1 Tax=Dokdonia ponticola TaxID=2041041 RepID=A0ABV9I2R6_9FLAO